MKCFLCLLEPQFQSRFRVHEGTEKNCLRKILLFMNPMRLQEPWLENDARKNRRGAHEDAFVAKHDTSLTTDDGSGGNSAAGGSLCHAAACVTFFALLLNTVIGPVCEMTAYGKSHGRAYHKCVSPVCGNFSPWSCISRKYGNFVFLTPGLSRFCCFFPILTFFDRSAGRKACKLHLFMSSTPFIGHAGADLLIML